MLSRLKDELQTTSRLIVPQTVVVYLFMSLSGVLFMKMFVVGVMITPMPWTVSHWVFL